MYKDIGFLMFNSNAIKFTHEGKVGIKLYIVPAPRNLSKQNSWKVSADQSTDSANIGKDLSTSRSTGDQKGSHGCGDGEGIGDNDEVKNTLNDPERDGIPMEEDRVSLPEPQEPVVWIRCDVYDTGIGIPGICLNSWTLVTSFLDISVECHVYYLFNFI